MAYQSPAIRIKMEKNSLKQQLKMCIRDRIVSTTGVGQAVGGMVGGAAIATKAVAAPATGGASACLLYTSRCV